MSISYGNTAEALVLESLRSSSRKMRYEYIITDQYGTPIGMADIVDGNVTFDSTRQVMRTFSGTIRRNDLVKLESIDYRLVPYMILDMDSESYRWPLGLFIIQPEVNHIGYQTYVRIQGYDMGKVALDWKTDRREYVAAGTMYTSNVAYMLDEMYTDTADIQQSLKTQMYDFEWDIGTDRLTIINDMLTGINYNPLHFTETGRPIVDEYIEPALRDITMYYTTENQSVIVDGITRNSNMFDVPNVFVRYTENIDAVYTISVYENNDTSSPYSIPNRGRRIVDSESVNNSDADQTTMDAYVRRVAIEKSQAAETLTFTTLNMPWHGYRDVMMLFVPEYNISGKYVETGWSMSLTNGGLMTHNVQKAVSV